MKNRFYVLILLGLVLTLSAFSFLRQTGEIQDYRGPRTFHAGFPLPESTNTLFVGSGKCEFCHGEGSLGPNPDANLDLDGNDISPVSLWQATMMANSSKDPFWQAKVSHEKLVNPDLDEEIDETCIKCHAPIGKFNAMHNGLPYEFDNMLADPLGMDGVSCLGCHSILPDNLGQVFSAEMQYDTTHTVFGQYTSPLTTPMQSNIGYTPVYSAHISSSALCGSCHTLITHPVSETGESLDTFFVEQAIYHEWLNSDYPAMDKTCQECHLPKTNFDVTIANRPPWLTPRSNFARHDLVGGNAFMLKLLADNIDTLKLTASTTDFELTLDKTLDMLQHKSMESALSVHETTADTVTYAFYLKNLAGHKLPGGYPSRRLIVEFLVQDVHGDTLFHSGRFNPDFSVIDEDLPFEPHYDIIRNQEEVQVYEMVMGDHNGISTTVLERAYANLKDNRLVPAGFSTAHASYDTVQIVGQALYDPNFNESNSGSDKIYYKIPKGENSENWIVTGRVYYQSVPPKWVEDMFSYSSPEIDLFKHLYLAADASPVLIAHAQLNGFSGFVPNQLKFSIYPNPNSGRFTVSTPQPIERLTLYNLKGQSVYSSQNPAKELNFDPDQFSGLYFVEIKLANDSQTYIEKVIFR